MVAVETNFLFYVMFWTILAMMLVLIYALKQVISTQRYIENIDKNIEKLVLRISKKESMILDEEKEILRDIDSLASRNKK